MTDASDIWTAICTAIAEDDDLHTLGVQADNVYYAEGNAVKVQINYPAVRVCIPSEVNSTKTSDLGSVTCDVQIDVFGVSQAINRQIADRLEVLLDVPRRRPGGFEVDGYSVGVFNMAGGRRAGGSIGKRNDADVLQLATSWKLRANRSI